MNTNSFSTGISASEFIQGCIARGISLCIVDGTVTISGGNFLNRRRAQEILNALNASDEPANDVLFELTINRDMYGIPANESVEWQLRDRTPAARAFTEYLQAQSRDDIITLIESRYTANFTPWSETANALNTTWGKAQELNAEMLKIANASGLFSAGNHIAAA